MINQTKHLVFKHGLQYQAFISSVFLLILSRYMLLAGWEKNFKMAFYNP